MELLKLQRLYAFVVMAQSGSLTEAAQTLDVTQQALSKTLAQLEAELNLTLIERRPWQVAPAGEALLQEALTLIEHTNALEDKIAALSSVQLAGKLRVAAPGYLDTSAFEAIKQLMRSHPQLSLQLQLDLAANEVERLIKANEIDLALLPCKHKAKGLKSNHYSSCPLVIVARDASAGANWRDLQYLAARAPEPMGELLGWPEDVPRRLTAESNLQTAITLAVNGHGALLLPKNAVTRQLQEGLLSIVAEPPFERQVNIWLVWSRKRAQSALQQALLQALLKTEKRH
ncbi:MAG: LysR family transcriptional regulator [Candidatus Sericytochromatia bacterium]